MATNWAATRRLRRSEWKSPGARNGSTPPPGNAAPPLLRNPEYRLHLEVFLESEHAELTAVAGLLVAAERQAAVERRAVEVDAPGADTVGDGAGAGEVL